MRLQSNSLATFFVLVISLALTTTIFAQTASTGAISGVITDPSGSVVTGAQVVVLNQATGEKRTSASQTDGYQVLLLPPGMYRVEITQPGFKSATHSDINVVVTETATVNIQLEVGATTESVTVSGNQTLVQTESAEMGHVTSAEMISNLPLVARNYTQIIALNPGISAEPTNATDLGRGNGAYGAGGSGFSANGSSTNDNNFQMNGVEINDTMGSQVNSGGIAIPNPDALEEFKVLTGQYDASYGRNAGANVNVITKSGTNEIHGSLFEYLRNDDMNANDWFRNQAGQPRAVLKQNQFGFTLGGPVIKNKLLYFGSYQGTRQRNGVSGFCSSSVLSPPLTNDRSRAALGALFAGRRGYINTAFGIGGATVAPDGSNITSQALALLQAKLPDGSYLIPTPQIVTPVFDKLGVAWENSGRTLYSTACPFSEDQYIADVDYLQSNKSKWSVRSFVADSTAVQTLRSSSATQVGASGVPGFPTNQIANFRNVTLDHVYTFGPSLINELTLGYGRQYSSSQQTNPYKFSDFHIAAPGFDDPPVIGVGLSGAALGGYGQQTTFAQNTYVAQDQLVWTLRKHTIRFGGGVTRIQINEPGIKYSGIVAFASFTDLLLGLSAADNGTAGSAAGSYSNVYTTIDLVGDKNAFYRIWDGNAYVQDDIKVTPRLTLNVGFRYERLGDMSQPRGLSTSFDPTLANPTPPATGTYAGWTVPSNYNGPMPPGITKTGNDLGIRGIGQNTWNPRLGFAWQTPGRTGFVVRGGFGEFQMRSTGQGLIQGVTSPPWTIARILVGPSNPLATAANPFPSDTPVPPAFPLITPTSQVAPQVLGEDFRPPIFRRYSLGIQKQFAKDFVLDVSYVGGRGTQLIRQRRANEAALASPSNPIRGVTTNTVGNVSARVPLQGLSASSFVLIENGANSWYNSLQASVNKRFSYGLQFLASYTFARDLTDAPGIVANAIGGSINGDQNNQRQHYGPDLFVRENRFVLSYVYALPGPKDLRSFAGQLLGGWSLAGVAVAQSGHRLTSTYSNAANAYGITSDRPDFVSGCALDLTGSVQNRLTKYFNTSCFTKPQPLVAGISATGFGSSPIGILHGPKQVNLDASLGKRFTVGWPHDRAGLEFRAEAFNLFNHPQFSDPSTSFNTGSFGQIFGTVTNPRIMQLALKFNF